MAHPPDTDIYSIAHGLLRRHRAKACPEALHHADDMLQHGDLIGCMVWRRIARAVEHIRRLERKTDMAA